jgi:hypothetical protein
VLAVVAVAAVGVGVALAVQGGGDKGGAGGGGATRSAGTLEIVRQPADAHGLNPFTASAAQDSLPADAPAPTASASPAEGSLGAPALSGALPGLYGGHRGVSGCDVEQLIAGLTAGSAKAGAFAGVVGIKPTGIGAYMRTLTPVLLRADTRVTNYGYRDGKAVAFPSVLQAGTAVLASPHGRPRVRCQCGNPLLRPPAAAGTEKYTGPSWSSFDASRVIAVAPASKPLTAFVLYDPQTRTWFVRPAGTTGDQDRARSAATTGPAPTPTHTVTRTPTPASPTPTRRSPTPTPSTPAATTASVSPAG